MPKRLTTLRLSREKKFKFFMDILNYCYVFCLLSSVFLFFLLLFQTNRKNEESRMRVCHTRKTKGRTQNDREMCVLVNRWARVLQVALFFKYTHTLFILDRTNIRTFIPYGREPTLTECASFECVSESVNVIQCRVCWYEFGLQPYHLNCMSVCLCE